MHLYKTAKGAILSDGKDFFLLQQEWDSLINQNDLFDYLSGLKKDAAQLDAQQAGIFIANDIKAPIGSQEVWAAGVTYLRSRDARMEESQDAGGADCYQKVYEAERPEIFFKSLAHRVAADGEQVCIRKDSAWNVPEPELTLYINSSGSIQGYTIGNDMSSRSIEGENPLYLPQAKVYERSAALGPCLYISGKPLSSDTLIRMTIHREGELVFEDKTAISRMKRKLPELAEYLFRALDFPAGAFLMTGTCLVPPNDFTLRAHDEVTIYIDSIGVLRNIVSEK